MSHDSIVDGDWLHATDCLMKYDTIAIELRMLQKFRGWAACTKRTGHGEDFASILTVKMQTRHPVEG